MMDEWSKLSGPQLYDKVITGLTTLGDDLDAMDRIRRPRLFTSPKDTPARPFPIKDVEGNIEFKYFSYQYQIVTLCLARARIALEQIDALRDMLAHPSSPKGRIIQNISQTLGTAALLKNKASSYFNALPVQHAEGEEHGYPAAQIEKDLEDIDEDITHEFNQQTTVIRMSPVHSMARLHETLDKNSFIYALLSMKMLEEHLGMAKSLFSVLLNQPDKVKYLINEAYPHPGKFFTDAIWLGRAQLAAVYELLEQNIQDHREWLHGGSSHQGDEGMLIAPSRALPLFQLDQEYSL